MSHGIVGELQHLWGNCVPVLLDIERKIYHSSDDAIPAAYSVRTLLLVDPKLPLRNLCIFWIDKQETVYQAV